jgi:hypothetical protein
LRESETGALFPNRLDSARMPSPPASQPLHMSAVLPQNQQPFVRPLVEVPLDAVETKSEDYQGTITRDNAQIPTFASIEVEVALLWLNACPARRPVFDLESVAG